VPLVPAEMRSDLDRIKARQRVVAKHRAELLSPQKGDGRELTTQEKIARARAEARGYAQAATAATAETWSDTDRQLEMTRKGNRQLDGIDDSITNAEKLMTEMERGLFDIRDSGYEITLPPLTPNDREVPIEMWKNYIVRYADYTMRFTSGCIMKINRDDEIEDTVCYGQIRSMQVLKKNGFVEIAFIPSVNQGPWKVYCEGNNRQKLVKEMAKRKSETGGAELQVAFQSGATPFDYSAPASASDRQKAMSRGRHTADSRARISSRGSQFSQMQAESDAFMDEMMGDLDEIGVGQRGIHQNLTDHIGALKEQGRKIKSANIRTKDLNRRADDWLAKNDDLYTVSSSDVGLPSSVSMASQFM